MDDKNSSVESDFGVMANIILSCLLPLFLLHLSPTLQGFGSNKVGYSHQELQLQPLLGPNDGEESLEILQLLKDELQSLRMDLTKSFIAEHSRKKRGNIFLAFMIINLKTAAISFLY